MLRHLRIRPTPGQRDLDPRRRHGTQQSWRFVHKSQVRGYASWQAASGSELWQRRCAGAYVTLSPSGSSRRPLGSPHRRRWSRRTIKVPESLWPRVLAPEALRGAYRAAPEWLRSTVSTTAKDSEQSNRQGQAPQKHLATSAFRCDRASPVRRAEWAVRPLRPAVGVATMALWTNRPFSTFWQLRMHRRRCRNSAGWPGRTVSRSCPTVCGASAEPTAARWRFVRCRRRSRGWRSSRSFAGS